MLAVKTWAKDKPYIIQIFAPQLALAVQDMHEEFQQLKLRRFASQKFPLPHLPSWFSMYRSHRKTMAQVKAIWGAACGVRTVKFFSDFLEELQKHNKPKQKQSSTAPTHKELKEAVDLLKMIVAISDKDIENDITKKPVKQRTKDRFVKLLKEKPLESSFYFFVLVPCWMLYRTSPTLLYRKARQGNLEALKMLLRLDQLMLHDPSVGKRIIEYRFLHRSSEYRKLLDCALRPPKGANSRKNILISLLGHLSALSHLTVKPLATLDLIKLVVAIDKDSKSNLSEDLPELDALARALQPDRNLWRQLFNPDKKM